ncbi:MAG: branched-chain amino acid ABC transporter permease [Marmoricola sp.]
MNDKVRNADTRRVAFAKGIRTRWDNLSKPVRLLFTLAMAIFLVYLPFLELLPFAYIRTDLTDGGTDWPSVLFIMTVYVIIAIGLNIVIGLAGLLDLGYVGFFAIGAYSVALFGSPSSPVTNWISERYGLSEEWAIGFAACVPIAIALTMVSGVILGAPTLRLRGDYLAIVTMGFGEIIRIVLRNSTWSGGPSGVNNIPKPPGPESADGRPFFNVLEIYRWYWLALAVVFILIWAVRRLEDSRVGRSWLAIREDEDAAGIMGVAAFKFKLWAFAMGAAIGGIAGVLFASRQAYIDPGNFQLNLSFLFVAMVVIGGSGNMLGAVVGAALLTYLPERFREFEEWRPFAFGVALVTVMVLRPQGLVPNRRRARELTDRQLEAKEAAVDV